MKQQTYRNRGKRLEPPQAKRSAGDRCDARCQCALPHDPTAQAKALSHVGLTSIFTLCSVLSKGSSAS